MPRPLPTLKIGPYRIAYQPITTVVECPCGGTITHHSRYFAGGRDEPPSEEYAYTDACEQCGCEDETQCDHALTEEGE